MSSSSTAPPETETTFFTAAAEPVPGEFPAAGPKLTRLIGMSQLSFASVGYHELTANVRAALDTIFTVEASVQAIENSKGVADGYAPLGPDNLVPGIHIGSFYSQETYDLTNVNDMTNSELVHFKTGEPPKRGDIARIVTGNKATQQTYRLAGDDHTVFGNWSEFLSPDDGVFSLSDVSGTYTNQKGSVVLAKMAFTGQSGDSIFAHTSFTATNVSAALIEVKAIADNNASQLDSVIQAMAGKLSIADIHPYIELTGAINGNAFTSSVNLTGAKVQGWLGGTILHPDDFLVAGFSVTTTESPDKEYRRPAVSVFGTVA